MKHSVKIGTRGSKLALLQTEMVAEALKARHPSLQVEIQEILTSGDWKPEHGETRLSAAKGGKGQFAKEIEQAILSGAVDCGVHSMKDMESFLPDGLSIAHMLPREDERDAFLANDVQNFSSLPQGAVVGTSSLRRQAFLLNQRPDLKIVPLRGNVPTRIEKLRSGQVDATILALAGLKRIGLEHEIAEIIEPEMMLPAAGQGAVGIEIRDDDNEMKALLDPLHCYETGLRVTAERAALQVLDGSCHTPVGAHAVLEGKRMVLKVIVASPDGKDLFKDQRTDEVKTVDDALALGKALGQDLKKKIPADLL